MATSMVEETEGQRLALATMKSTEDQAVLKVKGGLVGQLEINERILPHETDHEKYPHLADIRIPEVELKNVSLIIGEDVRKAHIVQDVRVSPDDNCGLYASKTVLGWAVAGAMEGKQDVLREVSVNFIDNDRLLSCQVEEFWKIEKTELEESIDRSASMKDRTAEDILHKTTKLVDSHYETSLLWKEDKPQLLNNRIIAES